MPTPVTTNVDAANDESISRLFNSQPVLIDVAPAHEVVPGMTTRTILTSGAPLAADAYTGGQRLGLLGAAVYEGFASTIDEAETLLREGALTIDGCHDHGVVGSVAGITSASMPVLVVEDASTGRRGFCTLFEGASPARLNYGVWNDDVRVNLDQLKNEVAPALRTAIQAVGGVPLKPIIERALRQGDELHSRNSAASLLFLREILPGLLSLNERDQKVLTDYLAAGDYFFLRPSMAACKVMADSMRDVEGSTLVTAMAMSCSEFSIRVSGTGDRWFRGPLPTLQDCHLFPGHTRDDLEVMGGESIITEVCGLGGLAQAAAFPLQSYQGGSAQALIERNLEMYAVAHTEHPTFKIPALDYRGCPAGIDIRRVVQSGTTPLMDVGLPGKGGGQVGAGAYRAPMSPFQEACEALGL
ncbi:DUF1116 domain-containing protein [Nonomuraea sp. NPDC026600]|uniref:DUF1116 domain-containing protein n=1 Tax=Nonomuraea sp. NPDC026600 TaxID=3155363 RepID=UPI0033CDCF6B